LQSQQELYTVSVESVPQYAQNSAHRGKNHGGCCRPGRVGKDLLCGVLIALAVICAAVAIFLVVYFVAVDGKWPRIRFLPSSGVSRMEIFPPSDPSEREIFFQILNKNKKKNFKLQWN
jgi:hypothetical protein